MAPREVAIPNLRRHQKEVDQKADVSSAPGYVVGDGDVLGSRQVRTDKAAVIMRGMTISGSAWFTDLPEKPVHESYFRNWFQTLSLLSFVCQAFYSSLCRKVISVTVSFNISECLSQILLFQGVPPRVPMSATEHGTIRSSGFQAICTLNVYRR